MFLDGIDLGIGKVVISDSHIRINNTDITINRIDISSKDKSYIFTFWTQQDYEKFNELELNKKTDILDYIDDYDIDFCTEEQVTVNSRENTEVYFTRIDTNKYILNVEIKDLNNCIIGGMENHSILRIETIIDFNKKG